MTGLTEAERRGARLLALLLVLGTAHDLWQARHPRLAPEFAPATTIPGSPPSSAEPAVPASVPGATGAPLVDLNTATAAELDQLPGIGPVLAGRIVEHRRRHGAFRRADELLTVPGIGPRLFERLRPALREPGARARPAGVLHDSSGRNAR